MWAARTKVAPMGTTVNTERIPRDVIVIGASGGGIEAVREVLSHLPADLSAFVGVVIHRGAQSPANWSDMLGSKTPLRVIEPAQGEALTRGIVYIAPSDCHMTFANGHVALDRGPKQHHTRPAVDRLFTSAALAYGPRLVGVVLTGGGEDGARGLVAVTAAGGLALVQRPSDAEHPSMPFYAIARNHVCAELNVGGLGAILVQLAHGLAVPILAADVPKPLPFPWGRILRSPRSLERSLRAHSRGKSRSARQGWGDSTLVR